MPAKRRTWRWVSRDINDKYGSLIDVHETPIKPECENGVYRLIGSPGTVCVCAKEFREVFGFAPRKGQCLKVDFRAKVIK